MTLHTENLEEADTVGAGRGFFSILEVSGYVWDFSQRIYIMGNVCSVLSVLRCRAEHPGVLYKSCNFKGSHSRLSLAVCFKKIEIMITGGARQTLCEQLQAGN